MGPGGPDLFFFFFFFFAVAVAVAVVDLPHVSVELALLFFTGALTIIVYTYFCILLSVRV